MRALRRSVLSLGLGMAVVFGLAGENCSVSPAVAASKITLLYVPVSAFTASWVAEDQGFFEKHGVDVNLSLAQNGALIAAALESRTAQIGAVPPPQLLQANEQGLDLVVAAGTFVYPSLIPGSAPVLARTGSGIKGAPDLIGKKVGLPGFGGANELLAKKWVELNGANYRKIAWVEIPFPQMAEALQAGLVDAVITNIPFSDAVLDRKIGYPVGDWSSAAAAGSLVQTYASTRSWAKSNGEVLKAFRAALDEAIAYIDQAANKTSVQASMAKWSKLPPQAAATVAIPSNLDARAKPDGMKFWIDISREQDLIKSNPDPGSLIAP